MYLMFYFNILFLILFASTLAFSGNIHGRVDIRFEDNNSGVVVYIDKIAGLTFAPPAKHARINQKDFRFIPKVLPVLRGTVVDFLNSDNVLHNVFSPDAPDGKFNLGTWPKGFVRADTFRTAGVATILCNVHPEMEAYVLALDSPYFAKSDSLGDYLIQDVPPGEYTLTAWYFSEADQKKKVTVPKTGQVQINFIFK